MLSQEKYGTQGDGTPVVFHMVVKDKSAWFSGKLETRQSRQQYSPTAYVDVQYTDLRLSGQGVTIPLFRVYEVPQQALEGSMPSEDLEKYLEESTMFVQALQHKTAIGNRQQHIAEIVASLETIVSNYSPNYKVTLSSASRT